MNDIKKDMIEQVSYFKETNPKGYMLYDDVEEMVNGVLEKYESFNNIGYFEACKQLQSYKAKEKELREYITSYESISIIQGLNDITKNKDLDDKTMIEMTNRYLEVHDKILDILDKE